MKKPKIITNEKGFVLLVVYVVVLLVTIFSIAFFARHHASLQATERYQNRVLAFNAAEAGIDSALRDLGKDQVRQTQTVSLPYTSGTISVAQGAFFYTISPVTGKPLIRRIDATGCAPNCTETSRAQQTSNITVYAQIYKAKTPGGLFDYGVYTTQTMTLSGFRFDSYTSSLPYGGSNISSDGSIAADSTVIGAITMTNTTIRGTALVNENGFPETGITINNSTIIPPVTDPVTPPKGNLPTGWVLGAPPPMASLPEPPIEIDLSSVTKNKTLAPGIYHTSSIHISGQATLSTSGAVKIYVDGNVDVTGQGTTAADNKPGNLHIYVTGTDVKIRGNGSFTGGLYAPNANVSFQTSNSGKGGVIYGAVVAKTFTTFGGGNPTVHYDLAMRTVPAPDPNQSDTVSVLTWQEMDSLAWGTGKTI